MAIVKDKMTSEDLVQNLFVQLWQDGKLAEVQHPERYLMRATKFKCIDYLRTSKNRQFVDLEEVARTLTQEEMDSTIEEADILPMLHYFASKLPPKTRAVFLLSREEELSYKEIAARLDISVKTVEGQMGRALRQMRVLLKEHPLLCFLLFF